MKMRTFIALALAVHLVSAQSSSSTKFEAATVKQVDPLLADASRRTAGGPGTSDPGRISYEGQSLKDLLFMAFRVQFYQVNTPGWMETAYLNVQARVPAGATREDLAVMLQNLLIDRFGLKSHRETKEVQGYVLTVGKSGIKMKVSGPNEPNESAAEPSGKTRHFSVDNEGFLVLAPGKPNIMTLPGKGGGPVRVTASMQSMDDLCGYLKRLLQQPVINHTELNGTFDFHLKFAAESMAPAVVPPPSGGASSSDSQQSEPVPTLLQAVESQLGLKIERKKVPVEMLVIDHIDRSPTAN